MMRYGNFSQFLNFDHVNRNNFEAMAKMKNVINSATQSLTQLNMLFVKQMVTGASAANLHNSMPTEESNSSLLKKQQELFNNTAKYMQKVSEIVADSAQHISTLCVECVNDNYEKMHKK